MSTFYPDTTRYAKLAAIELGFDFADLDNGNGYLFEITGNGRRLLSGAGAVCAYPINNASSYTIARDKAHTKSVLAQHHVRVIPGRHFFVSADYSLLRNPGHETADAIAYAISIGFPIFCKPLLGGRGNYAETICDLRELQDYMARLGRRYDGFLIEPLIRGDEYRVIVFDGESICYSLKGASSITGDGRNTAQQLLESLNASLEGTGISPYPASALTLSDVNPKEVPEAGATIPLAGRRNLSALGEIESLNTKVPQELEHLAATACRALSLRFGAVDIFDASMKHDRSELVVIEVNANPGLTGLERAGRLDLVLTIWKSMIVEFLER